MRIVISHPKAANRELWCAEMTTLLPGATVFAWQPGDPPGQADYAIGWHPGAALFTAVSGIKAFFSSGAGVDHVLGEPGYPADLPLIRLEDAGMARQMAEYCIYEVIRIYHQRERYEQQQRQHVWRELEPPPRTGFGVGVMGLGVLGAAVAGALSGLGYPVRGYSRSPREIAGIACFSGDAELPRFLAGCRVLILMLPLTAATTALVGRDFLAQLPAGAHLVNVARGALIIEDDLLAALDSGRLAGATLDVFGQEPLPGGHRFWDHPRVRITPHVAAITLVAESARQVAAKISKLELGEPVSGLVDRSRGY
ncbi:MAG: glyoxylate/hydroxypyruvate reductase A [Burkholderiaceae bacterium]|nr:glyoxylate/hydroxypyruvate reductase A [Burkholderiaceae bacterium]